MIRFTCSNCNHLISVDEKHAGKKGKCSKCGDLVVVPNRSTIIVFICKNCGHKIRIPEKYSGKEGACPKCKNRVIVPAPEKATPKNDRAITITCPMCGQNMEVSKDSSEEFAECPNCGGYVETASKGGQPELFESGSSVSSGTHKGPYKEKTKMNLKETIENHIVKVLVMVSIAAAGTTFATVNYLYNQKLEILEHSRNIKLKDLQSELASLEQSKNIELKELQSKLTSLEQSKNIKDESLQSKLASLEQSNDMKLKELQSKLASIERDVPGIKHFDVRTMFLSEDETNAIDPDLSYFEDDRFYAFKSDEYWKYSYTNEIELMELVTGMKFDSDILKVLAQEARSNPIHLWKNDEIITMIDNGEKMNLFPHIILQRISYESVAKLMGIGASFVKWLVDDEDDMEFNEEDLKQTEDIEKFLTAANTAFYNDAAGLFFLFQNNTYFQMSLVSPNISYKIKKLQKIGNILYSQFVSEYSDVQVSGKNTTVYIHQELIVVSDMDVLYLVKITLPSTEPNARTPAYAQINSWLSNIKFVRN